MRFYANKTMTTGEGGMVVTKSPHIAKRISLMRLHGIDRDAYARFNSSRPSWYYEIHAAGYKYNMTDMSAAIGIEQLRKLPAFASRRNTLANKYFSSLSCLPLLLPPLPSRKDQHAWHIFAIRILKEANIDRDQLIKELSARGIGTSVHYVPLHRQPFWKKHCSLTNEYFPNTEQIFESILSLPLYTKLTDNDQDYIIQSLDEILS